MSRLAPAVLVIGLLLGAGACQPTIGPLSEEPTERGSESPRLGAPDAGSVPQSIPQLLAVSQERALMWQDEPVLTEIRVTLDQDGAWADATAGYAAGDADRVLTVTATSEGVTEQRLSLQTLQAQPVPTEALAQVPPMEDFREPAALVEAAGECLSAAPVSVLYTTGAPFTWDGTQWSTQPEWRASVSAEEGEGVFVDPRTGEASCP